MFKVKNADANYSLEQLGNRICIIGCTASGKSTLANRLSKKLVVPVIHLDFLAHYEHTNWQRKSEHELVVAQQKVMQKPAWVIDGNYSICMPERFANATAIIWLDFNVLKAAYRYIKRSIFKN